MSESTEANGSGPPMAEGTLEGHGKSVWPHRLLVAGAALLFVVLLVGLLLPAIGNFRRTASKLRPAANLRAAFQSMLVFSNSNNGFLPGLGPDGKILAPAMHATGSAEFSGAAVSSRFWLLLNGQYIGADLLINPNEFPWQGKVVNGRTRWIPGRAVSSINFSYALLQLAGTPMSTSSRGHAGRVAEWTGRANSKSIIISDRNTGIAGIDASVSSVWTAQPGSWSGNVVWGDCRADMAQSNLGFKTRYNGVFNVGDNLFASISAAGVSEESAVSDANAMMVHE